MELPTGSARQRYRDLLDSATSAVVGLDYDGTLAPIVDEPDEAVIHPDAPQVLVDLAARVAAVAVVTGRPARQVLELGGLEEIGARVDRAGGELVVLGQYGNERWSTREPRVYSPRPPRGLATLMSELPGLLADAGLSEAHVEEKGLAVAVHTRRLSDPDGAVDRLVEVLERPARRHDLVLEPGRRVVEVRAPGMHKGEAIRALRRAYHADAMLFIGDDLGDVEAFRAVREMRSRGMVGLLMCSGSTEQEALVELADVVVDGPDGVVEALRQVVADLRRLTP